MSWVTNSFGNDGFLFYDLSNNRLQVQVYNVSTPEDNSNTGIGSIFAGKWYLLVFTYVPNSAKIYINNVLNINDTSVAMTAPSNKLLTLSRFSVAPSGYLAMDMARLTMQNTTTPWTTTQINNLYYYNTIPSGAYQWSMNNTANDQNGTNALTLTGTSYSTDVPPNIIARTEV